MTNQILVFPVWKHLSSRLRFQFGFALVLMLVSGIAEIGSLASVVPFLAVLSDPQRLWQYQTVQKIASYLAIYSDKDLLLLVTFLFGFMAILAAGVRLLNLWVNGRLSAAIGSALSCKAYLNTMYQPYSVHVGRNSSDVISAITIQSGQVAAVFQSTLQLFTSVVISFALLGALIAINFQIASMAIVVFGSSYALLSLSIRRRLLNNSRTVADATKTQIKILQEGLGAMRDVLLDGKQDIYMASFRKAELQVRYRSAENRFYGESPRYILEVIGMLFIAILGIVLNFQPNESLDVIPVLGTFALGAQRLLPAFQQIYSNWTLIRSRQAAIEIVLDLLDKQIPEMYNDKDRDVLRLSKGVSMKDLCFRYSKEGPDILKNISLQIKSGECIGFMGATGSGKSTLVDVLMGLLGPTSGYVFVDGENLHDPRCPNRLRSWMASIAHVPQDIYLTDSTFAENIAFGVPKHEVDFAKIKSSAEMAQISDYIDSCKDGYSTVVGERGVKLSGGQRQRIGIARALYKGAQVIVLDEATSALDSATEAAVIKSLGSLDRNLTVIMIAHRTTTLARCDRVFELMPGSPDSLLVIDPNDLSSDALNYSL